MLARNAFRLAMLHSVFGLMVCAGCSEADGLNRVALFGKVTLDDVPAPEGSISLLPDAKTNGPAANGLIRNGVFRFDESNGPVPGSYTVVVMIASDKASGGKVPDPKSVTLTRSEWKSSVEIPAAKSFEHSFAFTSQ